MQDLFYNYFANLWQSLAASPPVVLLQTYLITFVLLCWVGSLFWVVRDSMRRESGLALPVLALILTIMLPFVGALVYLLLRPLESRHEREMQRLEQEMASAQMRGMGHCPACLTPVSAEFRFCPICSASLRQRCSVCDQVVHSHFRYCPSCRHPLPIEREPESDIGLQELPIHTDRIIQVRTDLLIEPAEGRQFLSTYLDQLAEADFALVEVSGKKLYMQVFEARCDQLGSGLMRFIVLANSPESFRHNRVVLVATESTRPPLEIIHHSLRAA